MKYLSILLTIVIIPAATIAQKAALASSKTNSTKTEQSVLSDLNAQFIKNFLQQDTAAHSKIIHKDFVCIESNGAIVHRDKYLENWATDFDNSGYLSFFYSDESIRIFNNIALVTAKTTYTKSVNEKVVTGYTIYTDTYLKEAGKWRCVQVQITPVK
jgi:hypothetical protein